MSHPDGLPDLFLDRSLGRKKVPELLRAEGIRLNTLAELYGIPNDERIADTEWLQLCGERHWLAIMKDDRIRYVGAERQALFDFQVMAAVITNSSRRYGQQNHSCTWRSCSSLHRSRATISVRFAPEPHRRHSAHLARVFELH